MFNAAYVNSEFYAEVFIESIDQSFQSIIYFSQFTSKINYRNVLYENNSRKSINHYYFVVIHI